MSVLVAKKKKSTNASPMTYYNNVEQVACLSRAVLEHDGVESHMAAKPPGKPTGVRFMVVLCGNLQADWRA